MPSPRAAAAVRRRRFLRLEQLEARHLLAGEVVITEIMAQNDGTLFDEDGANSDWIELHNRSGAAVNLGGYYLTDLATNPTKWQVPNGVTIDAGGYLIVWASSKNRVNPAAPLHTNFSLSANGEYLGLIAPDGLTVEYAYAPTFPAQKDNISYGVQQQTTTLVTDGTPAKYFVPTVAQAGLGSQWAQSGFNDAAWTSAANAFGYGLVQPGFKVRQVNVNGGSDGLLESTTEALNVLNGNVAPGAYNIGKDITATAPDVNYGGSGGGNYGGTRPYLDGTTDTELIDFAMSAKATITIPVGTWTIGFGSDDGGLLKLAGVNFANEWGTGGDTPGDSELRYEYLRGHSWTSGQITVTGSPLTTTLDAMFFERGGGDSWEIAIVSGARTGDYLRDNGTLLSNGSLGWGVVTPSEIQVATNVQTAMQNANASLWTRTQFNVVDPAAFEALALQMHYNDGFVVYLNGQEVGRRNAPTTVAWNSSATATRSSELTETSETLNLTAFLPLLHAGQNTLAIQGLNVTAADSSFLIAPQLVASKVETALRYFATPTPGGPNVGGFVDYVAAPQFSAARGFYSAPFQLSLGTATVGASIRYTLDGSDPSETNGVLYVSPITVGSTSNIRVAAFRAGYQPSPSVTSSYIFIADVLQQSPNGQAPAGWPTGPVNGQVLDYGMDPDIVNSPTWGPLVDDALLAIPSLSITTDLDNLFDPATGIYVNATLRGKNAERTMSLELIDPNHTEPGFQINAGLRIRGGFSRSDDNPKHAFRFYFRSEYGNDLEYPMFGTEGASSFEKLDLRTAQNYSWSFGGDSLNIMNRDVFSRDAQRAMGDPYARSRYYHLYVNGEYFGLFQTEERGEAEYASTYFGGDDDDWDAVKAAGSDAGYTIEATDGTLDAWQQLWNLSNQIAYAPDQPTAYSLFMQAQGKNADGTRNTNYPVLLDTKNLVDYMLVIFYGGNKDAPISQFLGNEYVNNWFGVRQRNGNEGFKFLAHDSEHTLLVSDLNINRTGPFPAGNLFQYSSPQWIHQQLMAVDEYRMQFADLAQKHLFNGGALTPEAATNMFLARAAEIQTAIIAESARWGDSKVSVPYTKDTWQATIDSTVNQYFPNRTAILINQLKNTQRWTTALRDVLASAPLLPALDAPTFSQQGGEVQQGYQLKVLAPSSLVYYTKDGSDPRLVGGGISPTAIALDTSSTVTSLIAQGSVWKYLDSGVDQLTGWRASTFNDGTWGAGPAELGYGDGDEATTLTAGVPTVYFRKSFNVTNAAQVAALTLRLKRDDGAVVYLNGQELVRSNMPTGTIGYSTLASTTVGGADESTFYDFTLPANLLVNGANVLAVELHQSVASSSDLSFDLSLSAQVLNAPGIAINAATTIKARTFSAGTWSALNEADFNLNLPAAAAGNLAITEINYTPAPPTAAELAIGAFTANDFEFIELRNTSSEAIDLASVRFTVGFDFNFTGSAITTLEPGAFVVLVANQAAFTARYGAGSPIAGVYSGGLANGERLVLVDAGGATIQDFTYGAVAPWPTTPRGGGKSLEIASVTGNYNSSANWWASFEVNGSPGRLGVGPYARASNIAITELNYHPLAPTAAELAVNNMFTKDDFEFIELRNTGSELITLAGLKFTEGIAFDFAGAAVQLLAPGAFVLIVKNSAAFNARYGAGLPVAGSYNPNNLDNGGETLTLQDALGATVKTFAYDDVAPWPTRPDNGGSSLMIVSTTGDYSAGGSWGASFEQGGSPGTAGSINLAPTSIAIGAQSFPENAAGSVSFTSVTVTDPNAGDTFTFTISDSRFKIVSGGLQLKLSNTLDFETEPSIPVTITATDAGGLSKSQLLTITVSNANEAATAIALSSSYVMRTVAGAVVGNLTATDPEPTDTHTFTVNDNRFEVVGNQLKLKPTATLSDAAGTNITLLVTATDSAPQPLGFTKSFTLTVAEFNRAPTSIDLSRTRVTAGIDAAWVAEISAIDPDAADTHTWFISDSRFEVRNGNLYLKSAQHIDPAEANVPLTLVASDSATPSLSASRSVTLAVDARPANWDFAYQWAINPLDVDANGSVVPLDALIIINYLNANGGSAPPPLPMAPVGTVTPMFYDVDPNGFVTPLDALLVINYLNDPASQFAGEGEATEVSPAPNAASVASSPAPQASGSAASFALLTVALPGTETSDEGTIGQADTKLLNDLALQALFASRASDSDLWPATADRSQELVFSGSGSDSSEDQAAAFWATLDDEANLAAAN